MKQNKLLAFLQRFHRSERGVVTVDWVVITAGMVALMLSMMSLIGTEAENLATDTGAYIRERAE